MKNLIKSFLFTMVFLLIIYKPGVASTFATPNVELEGNADGIVFIQGDEPFLWSDNILPGDKLERNILLNNKHKDSYTIFMRAERINKKESYDLLEKIELKVIYDGNCIYDGFVSGQNGLENNIYLGEVKPGESKKLEAFAEFPGKEAGNEYKNKKAQVDWIFTAVKDSYGKEDSSLYIDNCKENDVINIKDKIDKKTIVPDTGDTGVGIYLVLIIISFLLLAIVNSKRKEKN